MSTYTKYTTNKMPSQTRSSLVSPWKDNGTIDGTYLSYDSTIPQSAYRPLPKDLFGAGTSRTITDKRVTCSTGVILSSNLVNRYSNAPAAYFYPPGYGTTGSTSIDINTLMNQARKDMRGEIVNLGQMCIEYRETAELFHGLSRAVHSHGRSMVSALRRKKGVAKAALAFEYGVRPLADDMTTALKEWQSTISTNGDSQYRMGKVKRKAQASTSGVVVLNGGNTNWEVHSKRTLQLHWRATMDMSLVNKTIVAHGFANPFALAWEKIPYSFVIDWWINVGDVLSSLDNLLLMKKLEYQSTDRLSTGEYYNISNAQCSKGFVTTINRVCIRGGINTMSPISTFQYKPSRSWKHIFDGTALLRASRLGGR